MAAIAPRSPQAMHSRAMQRVLSQQSAGSTSTTTPIGSTLITPSTSGGQLPSSPASGSAEARTPKASQASLPVLGGTGKKDEQLAQDLEELQVRSPLPRAATASPFPIGGAGDIDMDDSASNGIQITNGHTRTASGSTESSSSGISNPVPSQLGSMYGVEGFNQAPPSTSPYGYNIPQSDSPEFGMTPAAMAAVAAADEAIKLLNGTATVYQGPSIPGPQPSGQSGPEQSPYQLPRGYAGFVKPQSKEEMEFANSRQSSTSSSTTEASTSSEEEDLCIPRIEWVDKEIVTGGNSAQNYASAFFTPYQPQPKVTPGTPLTGVGVAGAGISNKGGSPARMPPPASTNRITSPRNKHLSSPNPGPSNLSTPPTSSSGHGPSNLKRSSALPSGVNPEAMDEDDDDQTIGQRDKSPGASIHSSESGLDILIRAATTHSANGGDMTIEPAPQPAPIETSPREGKGKRKAGSEAVDQWRNSGIPTGKGKKGKGKKGKGKAVKYKDEPEDEDGEGEEDVGAAQVKPPSKKRRRSSAAMEAIDPELLEVDETEQGPSSSKDDQPSTYAEAQTPYTTGAAANDDEDELEEESEPDDGANSGVDSEYGGKNGKGKGKKTAIGKGKTGTARKGTGRGRSSLASSSSKTGTTVGTVKRGKGAKGGKAAAAAANAHLSIPGGVQCVYTNPLPPYNRCQDVFTRKYDLPRHMARHARREGELVEEGKLSENKATLWATIKDRPKVVCEHCGEAFTRMDALKRHQAKQH